MQLMRQAQMGLILGSSGDASGMLHPKLSQPALLWKEQGTKAEAQLPILYHLSYLVAVA